MKSSSKKSRTVTLDQNRVQHILLKEPTPWADVGVNVRKLYGSQTVNDHGLRWEDGHVPYSDLEKILKDVLRG